MQLASAFLVVFCCSPAVLGVDLTLLPLSDMYSQLTTFDDKRFFYAEAILRGIATDSADDLKVINGPYMQPLNILRSHKHVLCPVSQKSEKLSRALFRSNPIAINAIFCKFDIMGADVPGPWPVPIAKKRSFLGALAGQALVGALQAILDAVNKKNQTRISQEDTFIMLPEDFCAYLPSIIPALYERDERIMMLLHVLICDVKKSASQSTKELSTTVSAVMQNIDTICADNSTATLDSFIGKLAEAEYVKTEICMLRNYQHDMSLRP